MVGHPGRGKVVKVWRINPHAFTKYGKNTIWPFEPGCGTKVKEIVWELESVQVMVPENLAATLMAWKPRFASTLGLME